MTTIKGFEIWDAEFDKKHFTPEEIAESDMRVSLITALVQARHEQGISQRQIAELSGIKQPQIARIERGTVKPSMHTLLKILTALGKKLAIVPIELTA